jgi:L-threonylcarbamoyladenylate synthase
MIIDVSKKATLSFFEKKIVQHYLEHDQILAFPTDTVYGLGVNGFSRDAIHNLYQIKGREKCKPLILFSDSIEKIKPYVTDLEEPVLIFMKENWPGPITLVLPFNASSSLLFSKYPIDTVAVRIPNQPLLLDLLASLPFPVVTTSANKSGQDILESAIDIETVFSACKSKLSLILDGGIIKGKPSKIIMYQLKTFTTLRS